MTMAPLDRARSYLARMPGAIGTGGAGGHCVTFAAAVAMVRGFGLSEAEALSLLSDHHNQLCNPKWSPAELRHKVQSAEKSSTRPKGYLLGESRTRTSHSVGQRNELPTARPVDVIACWTSWLDMLGDWTDEPDVYRYLDGRRLIIAPAPFRIAALPSYEKQREIRAELARIYSMETMVSAGIIQLDGRLLWPTHRLVIPWRDAHGNITSVQRRQISDEPGPRYVFPRGPAPAHPYGSELLEKDGPLAIVEGPVDTWAARLLGRADNLQVIGVHSKNGWREHWAGLAKGRQIFVGLDADADREAKLIADDCHRAGAASVSRWHAPAKDWADALSEAAA